MFEQRIYSLICTVSDDVDKLWEYLETLMAQLNVQLHDNAMIAIAYDTRYVELLSTYT